MDVINIRFNPLYKINAKKQIQVWNIMTDGSEIITSEGLLDGKQSIHVTKVKKLKNSHTLEKQAELEAASKWNDKKKTYWDSIEDAQRAGNDLPSGGYAPMLAHNCPSGFEFNNYWFIQPKLDGQRAIARKIDDEVQLFSRKGLLITSVSHINNSLNRIMENGEIFDGELYKHGEDFNESSGKIRSKDQDTSDIDYWVYDFPRIKGFDEHDSYEERYIQLIFEKTNNIVCTPTNEVCNFNELKEYHDMYVEDGFEGVILRNPNMPYENKRSRNLLKYKEFEDTEFKILGFNEGNGSLSGAIGSFTCVTKDSKIFYAKLKAPVSELKRLYQHPNEFMNKNLTVKFQGLSKDGIPRFPVGLKIR